MLATGAKLVPGPHPRSTLAVFIGAAGRREPAGEGPGELSASVIYGSIAASASGPTCEAISYSPPPPLSRGLVVAGRVDGEWEFLRQV